MDWNKIKAEYIAGGTSYRKLAEKHKVSFNTLQCVARREKWSELRRKAQDKIDTKTVNNIANDISKKSVKINDVADKLLEKMSYIIENHGEILLNSQSLKHFTSALKDIKDIHRSIEGDDDTEEDSGVILLSDVDEETGDFINEE